MAVSNLLALIDDVATLLDDVAAMTKVAGQKTAGVLGDDLALNAQQVVGVTPDRELPIVWAVFKGSLINKLILVPTALLLSAFLPVVIQPLLMLGGAFLCFEGAEKVLEKLFSKKHPAEPTAEVVVVDEKKKIRGAVTTDFILSAEIIAITLGIVQGQALLQQTLVLSVTAIAMTFFVYGIVAGIVKIDDFGLYLVRTKPHLQKVGMTIVKSAPYLMKLLGILGTVAMFLVGGGILAHGLHLFGELSQAVWFQGVVGIVAGVVIVGVVEIAKKIVKVVWPK